ncbi:hypothetical protein NQ318_020213 [Aromia moschata]|uniref:Uncharacterized protein n=1 Tax=Aromia moschata TaxID=1265417 RepID=A0AAV8Z9M0_9CUCU|nr:hypothetical protein NQ318_020213 [Aromia moschata]
MFKKIWQLQVFVDTSDVPNHLLNYLPLLFEALLELPIEQGGSMTPHEEIVRQLEADTIYRWTDSNYYRMPHTAAVCVEVEADKFDVGLTWFKKLLYQTRFTAERLTFVAKKMVAELKEDLGSATMYDAVNAMCFRKDSPAVIRGDLQRQKFLTSLIEKLSRDDCQKVLDDIEAVRRTITEPSKLTLLGTVFDYNFLDFDDSLTGCIIGADYAENDTWFCQVTKGVTSYLDPDYAALSLYVKYQGRDEGPLAGQVPDFKFFFDINISEGLLQFYCTRLTSLVDNYRKVKEILSRQIETRDWDPTLFERSKRETLCEILWELNSRVDLHCVIAPVLLVRFGLHLPEVTTIFSWSSKNSHKDRPVSSLLGLVTAIFN